MPTNKPRVPVTMEPELFERVKGYEDKHGLSSHSKAIKSLLYIALDGNPNGFPQKGKPNPMTEAGLDYEEREIIRMTRELDPAQKALLLRLVETAVAHRAGR